MTADQLLAFFGWSTLINFALLLFSTAAVFAFAGNIKKIHAGMFGIEEASLPKIYFKYLAAFKVLVIVFNLTPYIALRIIT